MMTYLWVAVGSALGGLARYSLTRWTLGWSSSFPWGTVLINVLGAFVIGFFGTFTLASGRFAVSENTRLFVMVGLCGGFTTFSSFSLQTFDLLRSGAWGKALANVLLSVVLCFAAVAVGHILAQQSVSRAAIAETKEEEFTA
jgi:CrcB protein